MCYFNYVLNDAASCRLQQGCPDIKMCKWCYETYPELHIKCTFLGNSSPCRVNGAEIRNFNEIRFIQTSSTAVKLCTCSREVPISYWSRVTKIRFPWDILLFFMRLLPPDFQTRQANRVSISHTHICEHFPPHSALFNLEGCNADLKISQSILLHMAPLLVDWGENRWWKRSVVSHILCQTVSVRKLSTFYLATP
jgi:hypothetical protein